MESVLVRLNLNKKEAGFYLHLLESGPLTASQLAKRLKESRTNAYMILDRLINEGLVIADNSTAVRRFKAAPPDSLDERLAKEESRLRQNRKVLKTALPRLRALYQTGQSMALKAETKKLEKYRGVTKDIAAASQVDVILSDGLLDNTETRGLIELIASQCRISESGLRILCQATGAVNNAKGKLKSQGVKLRFTKEHIQDGGIILFDDQVALIELNRGINIKTESNAVLTTAFRGMFDRLWKGGQA